MQSNKIQMSSSRFFHPLFLISLLLFAAKFDITNPAQAGTLSELEQLEAAHRVIGRKLKLLQEKMRVSERLDDVNSHATDENQPSLESRSYKGAKDPISEDSETGFIGFNHGYSYDMLDPTRFITRKHLYLLNKKRSGELRDNQVVVGGALTTILDYQISNRESKFGYLMRHPTSANQIGKTVSEAVIHSAQFGFTWTWDKVSLYGEVLYDPEQSFGRGTITELGRNQLQLRKGYLLFGDLDEFPVYAAVGKMDTPFGMMDTVNPFTASTVWHAFGGLTYGGLVGYSRDGLNVSLMAVQGGAQFRAAHTPVKGTNVPSRLNNYAIDANYTFKNLGGDARLMLGASYLKGSAYCQGFPIFHFESCDEANPAWDVYGSLQWGSLTLQGEFAQTINDWPGTFNPAYPEFSAHDVTSWGVGGKYRFVLNDKPLDLSAEFSTFIAGPDGAPWERQNQTVLGAAYFLRSSVKLFAEFIHTDGFAPLNGLTGTAPVRNPIISDKDAKSDIFLVGGNVAF